jgi:hypothetical protein
MRLMRKMGVWLGASLIGAAATGGCSGDFVETSTNQYSNYKEAVADGALQRGWLPRNLPDSAHNIVETHNSDTNELWAKFQLDQADINGFLGHCEEAIDLRLPSAARAKKMAAWWPEALMDKKGGQWPSTMQAYRCSKMLHAESELDAGMILDAQEKTAWYWIGP